MNETYERGYFWKNFRSHDANEIGLNTLWPEYQAPNWIRRTTMKLKYLHSRSPFIFLVHIFVRSKKLSDLVQILYYVHNKARHLVENIFLSLREIWLLFTKVHARKESRYENCVIIVNCWFQEVYDMKSAEICSCAWPAPSILAGNLQFHNIKKTVFVSDSYPAWTLVHKKIWAFYEKRKGLLEWILIWLLFSLYLLSLFAKPHL